MDEENGNNCSLQLVKSIIPTRKLINNNNDGAAIKLVKLPYEGNLILCIG